MMDDLEIKINELTDNPSARVPVCLCLDVSGSMEGEPIMELNEGIAKFYAEVRGNKLARFSADICIITFGTAVQKIVDFRSVDHQVVPRLFAGGGTPMGEAVNLALDTLELRKREYQTVGNEYYQPWLVLMTDGQPTDDVSLAARRVADAVVARKLTVFPVAIGQGADLAKLAKLSPHTSPVRLKELAFNEFFAWLSKSMVATSASSVGDKVSLPPITGWASL